MKKKNKAGRVGAIIVTLALIISAIFSGGIFAFARIGVDSGTNYSSNLFKDGSFENVTLEQKGSWIIDTTSEAASGGSWSIAEDAYDGAKAINLKGAGNKSGYPEVAQVVNVLPNTDYYFSFRLRNNNTAMSSANIFFGFASATRDENEIIIAEQHRWNDNNVDLDNCVMVDTNEDEIPDSYLRNKGYSLFSAKFNTGDNDRLRAYIRLQKMDATIDSVSLVIHDSIITSGSENLLKFGGFEGSDVENKEVWIPHGEAVEGMGYGFDDVKSTTQYRAGVDVQDKQIEGYKALYMLANSGVENKSFTVKQKVTVEPNTRYALYANLSKWGVSGLKSGTIGVMKEDGTVLGANKVSGTNISMARYGLVSTNLTTETETEIYVFITCEVSLSVGAYGIGLYVDDMSFFKATPNLPEGKTNLLLNGDLENGDDEWWLVGGNSQLGVEEGKKSFSGKKNLWLSQWNAGDGIFQEITLTKDTLYKVSVRANVYVTGTTLQDIDGLYSPVVITATNADGEVVARAAYSFERDTGYIPLSLLFNSAKDGVYKIFIGFDGGVYNNTWQGGVQIDSAVMFATTLEELGAVKNEVQEGDKLVSTSSDIVIENTTITVKKIITAAEFKKDVYATEGYTMKVVNASNEELKDADKIVSGCKVNVNKGEAVTTYSINVTAKDEGGGTEPGGKSGGCGSIVYSVLGISIIALALGAVLVFRKKRA